MASANTSNPLLNRTAKGKGKKKTTKKKTKAPEAPVPAPEVVVSEDPSVDLLDELLEQLDVEPHEEKVMSLDTASTTCLADGDHIPALGGAKPVSASATLPLGSAAATPSTPTPSTTTPPSPSSSTPPKKISKARARILKREQETARLKEEARREVEARNNQDARLEMEDITAKCKDRELVVCDVEPDGHCLYRALADQLEVHALVQGAIDFKILRHQIAGYIRSHEALFKPFITTSSGDLISEAGFQRYCDDIRDTAEWGGQPELQAFSQIYSVPVYVVQAGTDILKINDEFESDPVFVSYHRKMYGLGEHYNSLRPKQFVHEQETAEWNDRIKKEKQSRPGNEYAVGDDELYEEE